MAVSLSRLDGALDQHGGLPEGRGAMARVFVSHASEDAALAAEVHGWLVDDGHEAFFDQDLSDGLVAGEEWDRRLHERLRWADAVVCLLTSASVASVWCTAELAIARSRGSRLLPVQAEPEVRHPLLSSVQYVGSMAGGAESVRARVAEALRRVDVAGGRGWPDGCSPFPGCVRWTPMSIRCSSVAPGRSTSWPRGCVPRLSRLIRRCCWSLARPAVVSRRWCERGCCR
jgi:TIR domain